MFLNSGFNIIKKAGLFVFLLLPSLLVQAQVSDAAVTTVSDTAASGGVTTNADTSDAAVTTVESQAAEAAETSASEDQQRRFSFPRWPESRTINRERVPLAPPGPYMSSALSDYSFKEPSFDRAGSMRAIRMDPPDMSMKRFSPDIPWPSHAKSPERWQPENGYQYVEPDVKNKPYQMPYDSSSNYNYGFKRAPAMNRADSWSRRSKPVIGNPAH